MKILSHNLSISFQYPDSISIMQNDLSNPTWLMHTEHTGVLCDAVSHTKRDSFAADPNSKELHIYVRMHCMC